MVDVIIRRIATGVHQRDLFERFTHFAQFLALSRRDATHQHLSARAKFQQSFLVQVLLSLLPWALIIGLVIWTSRRAKTMLGSGNPFSGLLKNQSRKFDKATSVNVTFEDIAGLKAAKSDLQEIVQFLKEPEIAIVAAVYLHGLAGELGAAVKGEKSLIATDLLDYLPAAMQACANVSDKL